MNISFKGIKNVGFLEAVNVTAARTLGMQENKDEDDDYEIIPPKPVKIPTTKLINMQLTDDFNGKHLSEYKKLIAKHPEYKNPIANNFLNFVLLETADDSVFILNNKELKVSDDKLDIISFFTNNIKKIANQNQKDFVVNKDYLDSEDFARGFFIGTDLNEDYTEEGIKSISRYTHNIPKVKEGAQKLLDNITEIMTNYFEL